MSDEQKETVRNALTEISRDGRVTCPEALMLAGRLDINPRLVREAADELKLKIAGCQLGCF